MTGNGHRADRAGDAAALHAALKAVTLTAVTCSHLVEDMGRDAAVRAAALAGRPVDRPKASSRSAERCEPAGQGGGGEI